MKKKQRTQRTRNELTPPEFVFVRTGSLLCVLQGLCGFSKNFDSFLHHCSKPNRQAIAKQSPSNRQAIAKQSPSNRQLLSIL
jgi:hypothetical protein